MALLFDDLRVLRPAEGLADDVWHTVLKWDVFARDTVGGQLVRATDSIGANIAESFGRYHFGEKLQFLYYARGSLFEAKYWVNRSLARQFVPKGAAEQYAESLSDLALELNSFAKVIKDQRTPPPKGKTLRESSVLYTTTTEDSDVDELFTEQDIQFLKHSLLIDDTNSRA